ncbi:quinolinate synthase NadA [Clostridium estertheticum]|uniref:quinolinate synthase NadA n=1 Tax=Clostridium estertheticum TaxID=238834 RepID=UPI001C0B3F66|nr:quinolinate synthase NadA [Clostridium estertheticum]MBU3216621.1 quinolinate synthase NadA [Clostridium estertheticum]WAG54424.1 quinolinate synthase NadA [Clostridium estertheticum]
MQELKEKIQKLKAERNAIILAHYYQNDNIQEIADFVGDSYYLSKIAKECSEQIIVFCGVKFMAESAKILSPEKTVLLPNSDAGCTMADMINGEDVRELKKQHPGAKVICYINSTAEVKSESDICCTSSNALKIVNKLNSDEIIFIPDKNLGDYINEKAHVKNMIFWNGFCRVHEFVDAKEIINVKNSDKDIKILVHPECNREIRKLADFIGSTGEIIKFATHDTCQKYMVVTEEGILYELKNKNPNKQFITPKSPMTCCSMKKTTLEDVYKSLLNKQYVVTLDENIRQAAHKCLSAMHEMVR